ncbi:MAG TPA: hypothetical protein VGM05_26285 [Planctomycetaceae bacterium]|jgi:predicted dehydrogenase
MRFALLGDSPVATAVAQAVALDPDCRLAHWSGRTPDPPPKLTHFPGLRVSANWAELLTDADVDAVIVAESDDDWQLVVRQLLQAGKAVLVLPELVQSAAFFYELALFDAESPGKLFPLLDLRGHPLVADLRRLVSDRRLGGIRHVQFERTIPTGSPALGSTPAGLMTHAELTSAILIDADLLRALFGSYDQVTASRSGDPSDGFSLATVTLAGDEAPQAVWTAVGTAAMAGWKLTLFGESGTALLESVSQTDEINGRPLRLTVTRADQPAVVSEATADSGVWLLEQFIAEANRQSKTVDSPEEGPSHLWDELACAVELVDAVERSVRRRRTIDVYFETPSERGLFKTQMTAVGCSLLMLTLVAIVMYLVFEASIDMPQIVRQILVVLIFAPLGLFLALQLLFFVTRPASRE